MKLTTRMMPITIGAACLLALLPWAMPTAQAQQAAGSITGLVTDTSGAAVSNATVTVREVDQNATYVTKTTNAGLYTFPTIPAGRVEVKVEAQGFDTQVRSPFSLTLNQVARVDFQVKVGQVSQTVTVSGAPPLLQTGSTDMGT
ncbi:MAG: carboxypeptidase-like regulatory domain-containing protein, partial [Terriglobia bacterium]